jgi:hypothetical protein
MNEYNTITIGEDRATLGSGLSALMAAYSIGRYLLLWCRPLMLLDSHFAIILQNGVPYAGARKAINPYIIYERTNFFS